MSKRREKTRLETIVETIKVAELRLRIAADLDNPEHHRAIAVTELTVANNELRSVLRAVTKGKYP